MQPATLAWTLCLLPLLSIHVCWLWSALVAAIPWCNPYWDGCVSISKAARSSDALFLFRGSMIFSAGYLVIFWQMVRMYLNRLAVPGNMPGIIAFIGSVGAIFLVLYADFLGTEGDLYRLLRRYGVIVYFTFTVLAQMLLWRALARQQPAAPWAPQQISLRLLLWSLFAILVIGLLSLTATLTLENPSKDRWENALEWWFALLMTLNFGWLGRYWQQVKFNF